MRKGAVIARPGRRRRGQALVGVLIVVGMLGALAAALSWLGIEAQVAGSASRTEIAAMGVAEQAINEGMKVLRDTVAASFAENLQTVQMSRAQGWVTNSGSPCTWSGVVSQLQDILYHYMPLTQGTVPQQAQVPSPQASSAYAALWGTSPGPGGAYTWEVIVGIEPVPSPCPTWQQTASQASMTFPIGAYAFAWVWDPEGTPLGEMTLYTPPQTPGDIVLTYTICPPWYSNPACTQPTGVSVSLPGGELMWNDPNVLWPSSVP
jgi:hypothetical protein